jgi:hypothetical protein
MKFVNGSKIHFRSAERADNLRGNTATFCVVDEAAYMSDEVWKAVIRPMMLVKGRTILFISTPRGANWFKEMYDFGQHQGEEYSDYASVRMHYTDNPFINLEEIEKARKTLPQRIFAAEYEGSFEESGRQVFDTSNLSTFSQYPKPVGRVVGACDFGRANDYTVATFMDSKGNVVDVYRDNKQDWGYMIAEIVKRAKKWNASMLCESNSIGDVLVEQIKRQHPDTHPFVTSNKSKQEIIEGLILDIAENNISVPDASLQPDMLFELNIFEYQYSAKSRAITYSAPSPLHDDCVMSLAICNLHRKKQQNYGQYNYFVR